VLEFKPKVASFHFGLPDKALMKRLKAAGILVIASATTAEEARWLEGEGVDAVIAQGAEAGGHRGMFLVDDTSRQAGTMALVPQVVDAVKVPVIAAVQADKDALAAESADLLYHWLVVLAASGVSLDEVAAKLEAREGVSGHAEKAGRSG